MIEDGTAYLMIQWVSTEIQGEGFCKHVVYNGVKSAHEKWPDLISKHAIALYFQPSNPRGACFCYTKAMSMLGFSDLHIRGELVNLDNPPVAICNLSQEGVINTLCDAAESITKAKVMQQLKGTWFFPTTDEGKAT